METVMHEFKHHDLKSSTGQRVRNPKQAIAIGLSEARRSGADIPPNPNQAKKSSTKKAAARKSASKKAVKKTAPKKAAAKGTASKRKTATKKKR
jgi:hypothetical protein